MKTKTKTRQDLIKEADKYFSLYIRNRDKACVTCGTTKNLTCGHVITRSYMYLRWDEDNAMAQCSKCNNMHEIKPDILINKYIFLKGKNAYEKLLKKKQIYVKLTDADIQKIIDKYKNLCAMN